MKKNDIAWKLLLLAAVVASLLSQAPRQTLAANEVQFVGSADFLIVTTDTAASATVTASGQATLFDVQPNFIDITLDNGSDVTLTDSQPDHFIKITRQSGSTAFTSSSTCASSVNVAGTGAQIVVRLRVYTTSSCGGEGGGGGSGVSSSDTTPPTSFNIFATSITRTSAVVNWQTNEAADSLVNFGSAVAHRTVSESSFVTAHAVPITGLAPDTTYVYEVCSRDMAGNQNCMNDRTFTTLPADAFVQGSFYSVAEALAASPTINADKMLVAPPEDATPCVSGMLIKLASDNDPATQVDSAVYYCGADGKRYVFQDAGSYHSWYADFSGVIVVSAEALASVPLGGNVTYHPGSLMIKVQTDPKVYAVAMGGVLRWVMSEEVAQALYGQDWNDLINDVSDAFFVNYVIGEPITLADVSS